MKKLVSFSICFILQFLTHVCLLQTKTLLEKCPDVAWRTSPCCSCEDLQGRNHTDLKQIWLVHFWVRLPLAPVTSSVSRLVRNVHQHVTTYWASHLFSPDSSGEACKCKSSDLWKTWFILRLATPRPKVVTICRGCVFFCLQNAKGSSHLYANVAQHGSLCKRTIRMTLEIRNSLLHMWWDVCLGHKGKTRPTDRQAVWVQDKNKVI